MDTFYGPLNVRINGVWLYFASAEKNAKMYNFFRIVCLWREIEITQLGAVKAAALLIILTL